MGRPPLEVNTYGRIRTRQLPGGNWRAECRYRDNDGVTRPVSKIGESEAKAVRALKTALASRSHGSSLTSSSKFVDVAPLWLAEKQRENRGNSVDKYRRTLNATVLPAFGQLRLHEVTTPRIDQWVHAQRATHSASTTRGYRGVIGGVMGLAVRMGAITRNPVVGVGRIVGGNIRDTKRAMTPAEREDFLLRLDTDEIARRHGMGDVLRYMMGTGVRLSEALGLRWFRVDLREQIVVHGDSLVQETGKGLVLHEPKSLAGFRVLPLPDFVVRTLHLRYPGEGHELEPVFGNTKGGFRTPSNVHAYIRADADRAGYPWFTSHVLRHTAATVLDQYQLTAREISGYIGHANPAFTQSVYMDQRPETLRAATALDDAARPRRR
jgi:integrase